LLASRWWEGPPWVYKQNEDWPAEELVLDETAIFAERKKLASGNQKMISVNMNCLSLKLQDSDEHETSVGLLENHVAMSSVDVHPWYIVSSSYIRNIRVIAWMRRFLANSRPRSVKRTGPLTVQEFIDSEITVMRIIQQEELANQSKIFKGLVVQKATDGLYHVKTKITHRDDIGAFCFPVLLPSSHPVVTLLTRWYHVKYQHAGTQFLMSKLRQKFWILQSRRAINRVIYKCPICLHHSNKSFQVDPATLPSSRTEESSAFRTTGVDLAGPLYLKNGDKVWLVLFTCAVYRCVHLDFVTSLSTEAFLRALERFINIRGRPATIYSDNGTNFVGFVNLYSKLNWSAVEDAAHIKQIKWIFKPPICCLVGRMVGTINPNC
jgi:hypothetical protein